MNSVYLHSKEEIYMRRHDKEITEILDIEDILLAGNVCQLAFTVDPAPYIVTLNYAYHDNILYFHSASKGRKIDLAKLNPHVGFSVSIDMGVIKNQLACDWSNRYRSVVGHGVFKFINTLEEKHQALGLIMSHYSEEQFTFPEDILQKTSVYCVEITEMAAKQSGRVGSD